MAAMNPLRFGQGFRTAIRAFAFVAAFAAGANAFASDPDPGQRLRLSPEQRREMWQRMSPEQRDAWRNARSPEERQRAWQGLSPDQRRDMSEHLSPEQREMMMRRLPPDQRREMWRNMSPEQREAMRQRFLEQRPQGEGVEQRPRYSMSPEERQRLREQIREAQKDVYRGAERSERGGKK